MKCFMQKVGTPLPKSSMQAHATIKHKTKTTGTPRMRNAAEDWLYTVLCLSKQQFTILVRGKQLKRSHFLLLTIIQTFDIIPSAYSKPHLPISSFQYTLIFSPNKMNQEPGITICWSSKVCRKPSRGQVTAYTCTHTLRSALTCVPLTQNS
jgi:hypothetical protein